MALTLYYAGHAFRLAETNHGVVETLLHDRLNLVRHRRDDLRARTFFDAEDEDLRADEGPGKPHMYDPFVTLGLANGGVVTIHLHDGMTLALVGDRVDPESLPGPTDLLAPVTW